MPIPVPRKGKSPESRSDFISRCAGDSVMNREYTDQKQRLAICYSQWSDHKAKASYVIEAADDEYAYFTEADSIDAPVSSTPSYDENPDNPKMPPSVKTVSPKDSQPKGPEDSAPEKPVKKSEDDGDSPDLYDEVDVQAARKCYPYGTKCPACHAPTVFADVGFGHHVLNECESGHQYEAREAIAVRKPALERGIRDRLAEASTEKPTKLHVPENWEMIKDMGTKDFTVWAGANDWENSWSAVAFQFHGNQISRATTRVWGHIVVPKEADEGRQGEKDFGKGVVQSWLKTAKALRDAEGVSYSYRPEHFAKAASHVAGLRGYGIERVEWKSTEAVEKPIRDKEIDDRIKDSSSKNPKSPNPEKGGPASAPNPDVDTAGPIDSQDTGVGPAIGDQPWFLGSHQAETDKEGVAKWPLSFKRIEKDFNRPNKPGNPDQEPKAQDSQKPDTKDEPYQMSLKTG